MAFFKLKHSTNNLSNQIKRAIGFRIFVCFILSLLVVFIITINEVHNSFEEIERKVDRQCESLSDFVIGQILIDNRKSIQPKLNAVSDQEKRITITWQTKKPTLQQRTLHFSYPLFSWEYIYSVVDKNNKPLGYFLVKGSLLNEEHFFYALLNKLLYLLLLFIAIFIILFPLGRKIPQQLFTTPINHILSLLKNKENNPSLHNMPEEIHEISEKITHLLNEAKQLSREAALGQLSAKVAHDMGSPLMSMTKILKEISPQISDEKREALSLSIQSVRDIANNLLARHSEKQDRGITDNIDDANLERYILLFSLIEQVVSQKRYEWKKNTFDLEVMLDEQAINFWIFAAPNDIKRILSNLLNNAYEALEEQRKIVVSLSFSDKNLILSIKDAGRGISADKIDAVLTGNSFKKSGHGLGLSNAKKEIEKLGGELILKSKINMGTEVKLIFPLYDHPIWFPHNIMISNKKPVLILDDDNSVHNFWSNHAYPILCHHFVSSDDVFEWIDNQPDTEMTDLTCLFDYELFPEDSSNGLEILEQLKVGANGYLITSRAEELEIQNRCAKAGIWLIPKSLLDRVPLEKEF